MIRLIKNKLKRINYREWKVIVLIKKIGVLLLTLSMAVTPTGIVNAQEWENADVSEVTAEETGTDFQFSDGSDGTDAENAAQEENITEKESGETDITDTSKDNFSGDTFTEENNSEEEFSDGEGCTDEEITDEEITDGQEASDAAGAQDNELVDTSDIVLYALEWKHKDAVKSMPKGLDSYQIKIKKDGVKPVYKVTSGDGIEIDKNGLITLRSMTVYVDNKKEQEYWFGDNIVTVTIGKKSYNIKVTVRDYAEVIAEQRMNEFVDTHISASMSQYDKVKTICEWLSKNFSYSARYYEYVDLMLYNCGDCWANTKAVNYMCKRAGIEAYTRYANIDAGAGSGHKNSIAMINGEKYLVDCGFVGNAPRSYTLRKFEKEYSYQVLDNNTVKILQYEGLNPEVVVPDTLDGHTVSVIGEYAFSKTMVQVTSVKLPDTVTALEDKVFFGCRELKSVTIPKNVQSIGQEVFGTGIYTESQLTEILVAPENKNFASENGAFWNRNTGVLLAYAPGRKGTCIVPEGVTKISDSAFEDNKNITKVQFPSTLKEIGTKAFENCKNLENVKLPEGLLKIGSRAFYWDTAIPYLEIPETVQEIDSEALYNIDRVIVRGMNTQLKDSAVKEAYFTVIAAPKGSKAQKYANETDCVYIEAANGQQISLNKKWFKCYTEGWDYTGKENQPSVYLTNDGKFLGRDEDFSVAYKNNINAGTGSIEIIGKGIFSGTLTVKFTINPVDLNLQYNQDKVTFTDNGKQDIEIEETGKAITPAVQVKGYKEGRDYTVSYKNNIKPGYAEVIIKGKGNYTGTYSREFYIKPASLTIKSAKTSCVYNGKFQEPSITVRFRGKKLKSSEYTVAYDNNREIGDADIYVWGKGKYSSYYGAASFRIIPAGTSLKTVKSSSKGQFTAQWNKKSGITGYQIAYSMNADFSDMQYQNVKSTGNKVTVSGLKSGKKYYVHIRTYKKGYRKTFYSEWSTARNLKVK